MLDIFIACNSTFQRASLQIPWDWAKGVLCTTNLWHPFFVKMRHGSLRPLSPLYMKISFQMTIHIWYHGHLKLLFETKSRSVRIKFFWSGRPGSRRVNLSTVQYKHLNAEEEKWMNDYGSPSSSPFRDPNGEVPFRYAVAPRVPEQLLNPISFPKILHLPKYLIEKVVDQCDHSTLFQLMRCSRPFRDLAERRSWSDPTVRYTISDQWWRFWRLCLLQTITHEPWFLKIVVHVELDITDIEEELLMGVSLDRYIDLLGISQRWKSLEIWIHVAKDPPPHT